MGGELKVENSFLSASRCTVVLHYDRDRIEPLIVPLDRVAGKTRHMPGDFFADSNTISDEGRRYFRRLLPKRPDIFLPFL
jgi:ATP-dependent phosphofructokinase / diphosphate-dependent phosphofructokinase